MADTSLSAWPAPAKLNLMLRILGRRPDGYHRLQTVFQLLDRCDLLWFDVTTGGDVIRIGTGAAGVAPDDDLAVRAARALQVATGCRAGVRIRIRKHIPAGAGLGGGSSDAATTLLALNRLWGTGLAEDELAALGCELGADVPVFVRGCSAWAEGIGERLSPLALGERWYLVVMPPVTVSTGIVFADPELTRDSAPITIRDFLAGAGGNDCETVVHARYPEVAEAARWLSHFGTARLTGTGACVFASFADNPTANRVLEALPRGWTGFVARGMDRSPLRDRLADTPACRSNGP